ncbi:MAG: hypothetical protein K6F72_00075 [Bacteroidales bacterium]|nr:hypothetical protein [Bacteroidales bacterium]
MKHTGNKPHYVKNRNRELLAAYRKALDNADGNIRLPDICRTAANTPCSRFWISEERARDVITLMLKGQYALDEMKPLTREMYIEIFHRVSRLRDEKPDDSLYDLVFAAVNSPAPKFYLTPESVLQIIWRIRRGHYVK